MLGRCYSAYVREVEDDFCYLYKGFILNINYFSRCEIQKYRDCIPRFRVAIISRPEPSSCSDWGVVCRRSPISFNSLSKKSRYEVKKGLERYQFTIASEPDLPTSSIAGCFIGAASRAGFRITTRSVDEYVEQVRCHLGNSRSRVYTASWDGVVHAIALVNVFAQQRTINIKNLKIDYGREVSFLATSLMFRICADFEDELSSGWTLHAGTSSIRHGSSFQDGVLRGKLGFEFVPLTPQVIVGAGLSLVTRIGAFVTEHAPGGSVLARFLRLTRWH